MAKKIMRSLSPSSSNVGADVETYEISMPTAEQGSDVNSLISRCQPLDENSVYCNLLQCTHFSLTSAITTNGVNVCGFVSGYLLPEKPNCLFIWQVAVDETARGHGLAKKMILDILARDICRDVTELHTTITSANIASQALFGAIATSLKTEAKSRVEFDQCRHLGGTHDSEYLWVVGPFENFAPDLLEKAA